MLLDTEVEVIITPRNVNHYKNMGYIIPTIISEISGNEVTQMGAHITVKVSDLSNGSKVKIHCSCDNCGKVQEISYVSWKQRTHLELGDLCKSCATKVKLPQIMEEEYGCSNAANISCFIDKKKNTNLQKYGVEWAIASKQVREEIVNSYINNYGVSNPMKNIEVKQKTMNTNKGKYGCEYVLQNEDIKQKGITTCLTKYGVKNAYQNKEIQAKAKQTLYQNGNSPVSQAEQKMCALLKQIYGAENCFPSALCGPLTLDCLLQIDGQKIDFEYDGVYWHKNRQQKDAARNAVLLQEGYKIVRIKANNADTMPTIEQIKQAVDYLVKDNHHLVFIDMNN